MAIVTAFIEGVTRTKITRYVKATATGTTREQLKPVVFQLDALESETLKAGSKITDHPVEEGVNIADHQILEAKVLTIEGRVTATPMDLESSIRGAANSATQLAGQKALGTLGSLAGSVGGALAGKSIAKKLGSNSDNRLRDFMTELDAARDSRAPIELQTGLARYPTDSRSVFLLESYEVRRKSTFREIEVTLVLKQVVKATSQTTKVLFPKEVNGAKKAALGSQAKAPLDAQKESRASILSTATGIR